MPKKSAPKKEPEVITVEQLRASLVEKAKKAGEIKQRDITEVFPDSPDNVDILDRLYTELADNNIKIVTASDPAGTEFSDAWVAEDNEEVVVTDQVYLDDVADDSVRLYLREIGKIPLLKADEELALANRVVAGDKEADRSGATRNPVHCQWCGGEPHHHCG